MFFSRFGHACQRRGKCRMPKREDHDVGGFSQLFADQGPSFRGHAVEGGRHFSVLQRFLGFPLRRPGKQPIGVLS